MAQTAMIFIHMSNAFTNALREMLSSSILPKLSPFTSRGVGKKKDSLV